MTPIDVTLIVPFLAGDPGMREAVDTLLSPPPEGLGRCLQKADRLSPATVTTDGQRLSGLTIESAPAALSYLADTGRKADGYCLRADPVTLTLGRRGLLMGAETGPLDRTTLETLEGALAPLFAETGMRFELLANGRGYLHLPSPPTVRFSHRAPVTGEDITPLMPVGDAARDWRRLLNECQTRLHRPAFETGGAPTAVNSLFFWGGGILPRSKDATAMTCTWSNDPVLRGAARLAGTPDRPLPRDAGDWLDRVGDVATHLLHLPGLEAPARVREYEDWARALADYEMRWFAPLVAAVEAGRVGRLSLLANEAGWSLRRSHLRRWWRRRRLTDLMRDQER